MGLKLLAPEVISTSEEMPLSVEVRRSVVSACSSCSLNMSPFSRLRPFLLAPLILSLFLQQFFFSSGASAGSAPTYLKSSYGRQTPDRLWRDAPAASHSPQYFLQPPSVPPGRLQSSRIPGSSPATQQKNWTKHSGVKGIPGSAEKRQGRPGRLPGLPRNPPWPTTVNVSNVVRLLQSVANDEEINDETEELLVKTLGEVGSFIGLQDTRDFFGMFLMYFILGPILIPLYWLPISLLAIGFLMIPLVYNSPTVPNGRNLAGVMDEGSNCLEMVSCEVTNMLRRSSLSSWVDERFNLTQVEWTGREGREFQRKEECSKYSCVVLNPVRRFFSAWYSHFFTFQNLLKSNSTGVTNKKKKELVPISF